jgi:biopolymer transport protein ExbB/TolQ
MSIENIGGVVIIGLFVALAAYSIYFNYSRRNDSNKDDTGSK